MSDYQRETLLNVGVALLLLIVAENFINTLKYVEEC